MRRVRHPQHQPLDGSKVVLVPVKRLNHPMDNLMLHLRVVGFVVIAVVTQESAAVVGEGEDAAEDAVARTVDGVDEDVEMGSGIEVFVECNAACMCMTVVSYC